MPTKKSAKSPHRATRRAKAAKRPAKRAARKPLNGMKGLTSRASRMSQQTITAAEARAKAVPSELKDLVRQARALTARIAKAI